MCIARPRAMTSIAMSPPRSLPSSGAAVGARRRATRVTSLGASLAFHAALAAAVVSIRVGVAALPSAPERPEDARFELGVAPPAERSDDVVVLPPSAAEVSEGPPSRGTSAATAIDFAFADEEPPPPAAPSIAVRAGAGGVVVPREWSPRPSVVRGGFSGRGHGSRRAGGAGRGGTPAGVAAAVAAPVEDPAPVALEPAPVARVAARVVSYEEPRYPESARQRREQGVVRVEIEVLADGTAGDVRVVESSGSALLDAAAAAAVRRWKFAPATVGGEPVPSALALPPIRFRLQ
jgi:protein TonB